jgi:hypothetical protein
MVIVMGLSGEMRLRTRTRVSTRKHTQYKRHVHTLTHTHTHTRTHTRRGLVEGGGPGLYDWNGYRELLHAVIRMGYKVKVGAGFFSI